MQLAHLKTYEREDGSTYLGGQVAFDCPRGSILTLKDCKTHDGCMVLVAITPLKKRPTKRDADKAARKCG